MEFCTSANLVVVEAKEEEKIADPCDRDKGWVFSNRKMSSCHTNFTYNLENFIRCQDQPHKSKRRSHCHSFLNEDTWMSVI